MPTRNKKPRPCSLTTKVRTCSTPSRVTMQTSIELSPTLLEFHRHTAGLIERYNEKVIKLEDKAIRQALIKLGWTPPKEAMSTTATKVKQAT